MGGKAASGQLECEGVRVCGCEGVGTIELAKSGIKFCKLFEPPVHTVRVCACEGL